MNKWLPVFSFLLICMLLQDTVAAQCAMCTKTAQQLGEKPALGLNRGILYLMLSPFLIVGVIGFRWWKTNKKMEAADQQELSSR